MAKPSSATPDDRRDKDDGSGSGIPFSRTDNPVEIDGPTSTALTISANATDRTADAQRAVRCDM